MNAKLLGLVIGASLAMPGCVPEVSQLSCGAQTQCPAGTYCDKDLGGGRGVCVTVEVADGGQPTETSCADGNDNDRDGFTDCDDPDCRLAPCRPSIGPCDEAESCVIGQTACPEDKLVPETTNLPCREKSACGAAGICDGKTAACPGMATAGSKGATCREETPCGKAAFCDGANPACPPFDPKDEGTYCAKEAPGPCLEGGVCDGQGPECPQPVIKSSSTPCPGAKGCELQYCSGADGACRSALGPKDLGTVCREAAGPCDLAEECDGASRDCPADTKRPAGDVCQPAKEDCELASTCDNFTDDCPPVAVAGIDKSCRGVKGPCDVEEFCDGTARTCPDDQFVPKEKALECQPSKGACDPAELCDGTGAQCPKNVFFGGETVCGPSMGGCDPEEVCDGVHPTCPQDVQLKPGDVCDRALGPCETASTCPTDGSLKCPEKQKVAAATKCGSIGDCGYDTYCDGQSEVCPKVEFKAAGSVCGLFDPCVPTRSCDGQGACPPPTTASAAEQCGLTSVEKCASPSAGTSATCPWPAPYITTATGWMWEHPLPQGNDLHATASNVSGRYFVGDAGTALHYVGATNVLQRVDVLDVAGKPFRGALRGVCVDTLGTAWVVGDQGYVGKRTTIAAQFTQVTYESAPPGLATDSLHGVWCEPGSGKFFAVGLKGAIYRYDGAKMSPEPSVVTVDLTGIWGSSPTDLWVVGKAGVLAYRDANGWRSVTCDGAPSLTGVSGFKTAATDSEVLITAHSVNQAGIYVVKRSSTTTDVSCVPYEDTDKHPPPSQMGGISMTGSGTGWAVDDKGRAYELKGLAWSEPIPVGIGRPLEAVDASALGGVAVVGQAGAISVRALVNARWKWLPSRAVSASQLNAVWAGTSVDGVTGALTIGNSGTVLQKTETENTWVKSSAWTATTNDNLLAIGASETVGDVWLGGAVGLKGSLYQFDGTKFVAQATAPAPITSVGINPTHVTVAAGQPYQLFRSPTSALKSQSTNAAKVVSSTPAGADAYFADAQVFTLQGGNATANGRFPPGSYVGLETIFDAQRTIPTAQYAISSTDKVAYFLDLADATGTGPATPTNLPQVPFAMKVVSEGKFWVVGASGMATLVGSADNPDWAGTNFTLRGVALDAGGGVFAVGDRAAILHRLAAVTPGGP